MQLVKFRNLKILPESRCEMEGGLGATRCNMSAFDNLGMKLSFQINFNDLPPGKGAASESALSAAKNTSWRVEASATRKKKTKLSGTTRFWNLKNVVLHQYSSLNCIHLFNGVKTSITGRSRPRVAWLQCSTAFLCM